MIRPYLSDITNDHKIPTELIQVMKYLITKISMENGKFN